MGKRSGDQVEATMCASGGRFDAGDERIVELLHRLTQLPEGALREKVASLPDCERARLAGLAEDILDDVVPPPEPGP